MSDLTQAWHCDRKKLETALGNRLIAHERIAMFGPRQTGKTTLLRDEVIPYVQSHGCVAVYIDCWLDRTTRCRASITRCRKPSMT